MRCKELIVFYDSMVGIYYVAKSCDVLAPSWQWRRKTSSVPGKCMCLL